MFISIMFFKKINSHNKLSICYGFEEFLEIMNDKSHPERDSYIEWYGSEFDPNQVDLDQINKDLANLEQYIIEVENPQD